MGNDKAASVAAPTTFEHEGKVYFLCPPTIRDFKELRDYLRSEVLSALDRNLKGIESKDLRDVLVARALNEVDEIEINSSRFNELCQNTPEGIAYLFWLTIRKKHPEVSLEEAERIFTEQAVQLHKKMNAAAGYDEAPNGQAPPQQPAAGKRRKAQTV